MSIELRALERKIIYFKCINLGQQLQLVKRMRVFTQSRNYNLSFWSLLILAESRPRARRARAMPS